MEQRSPRSDDKSTIKEDQKRVNDWMDPDKLNTISRRILCSNTISRETLRQNQLSQADQDEEFYKDLRRKIGNASGTKSKENQRRSNDWRNAGPFANQRRTFHKDHDDIIKRFRGDIKRVNRPNCLSIGPTETPRGFDLNVVKRPQATNRLITIRRQEEATVTSNNPGNVREAAKNHFLFHPTGNRATIIQEEYEEIHFCEVCTDLPSSDSSNCSSLPLLDGPNYSLTSPDTSQYSDN